MSGLCNHSRELTGPAGDLSSPVHRLDPRAKLVGLLAVTLTAVSAGAPDWPVFAGCGAVLAGVGLIAGVSAGDVWRRVRLVLPIVLAAAALIPLVRAGGRTWELGPLTLHEAGLLAAGGVSAKATIGTLSAVLLGCTTPFPAVLRGLQWLRVPGPLLLITAFMYRYLFVIVDEVGCMRAALAARGHRPGHLLGLRPIGRLATALFLRSYARGERVYLAMLARGYAGTVPQLTPLRFARTDAAFVAAVLAVPVATRIAIEIPA